MSKTIGVAEVKRRFSEVIGKVSRDGEQIIIQKNHKPLVAMVSLKDFEIVKKSGTREENKGLLAAIGAWDDFEDIDRLIKQIYMARRKAKDRGMKGHWLFGHCFVFRASDFEFLDRKTRVFGQALFTN